MILFMVKSLLQYFCQVAEMCLGSYQGEQATL